MISKKHLELVNAQAGDPLKPPLLSHFDDYRAFLGAWYSYRKQAQKGFSYTVWGHSCGFASRAFLRDVIQGKKNLTAVSIPRVSASLGLEGEQLEEFHHLVLFGQAKKSEQKEVHFRALCRLRRAYSAWKLRQNQHEFYSRWYHSTIRELATGDGVADDVNQIAAMLQPRLSPQEVERSLALLNKLGLVERKEGIIRATRTAITTGDEVSSHFVKLFHRENLELTKQAIDKASGAERDLSALVISLSEEGFREAKTALRFFRKQLAATADRDRGEKRCYHLSLALIPTTRIVRGKGRAK